MKQTFQGPQMLVSGGSMGTCDFLVRVLVPSGELSSVEQDAMSSLLVNRDAVLAAAAEDEICREDA